MTKRRSLADLIEARFVMMRIAPDAEITLWGLLSPELLRRMALEAADEAAAYGELPPPKGGQGME